MEAAVSSSMGAMGPVLRKLEPLLAPESRLRKRVKDGIGLLKEDLEEVSSALVDLSMLETPTPRAKCWMEEARELSYHVEDFIDELMLMRTDAGAKLRSVSRHRVGRVKIALLPAVPRRSTRVVKIAQLRDLVWQASERLERYQLDACCSKPKHMNLITQNRRAPALYGDAANLVGIEDSRTKLIEMLTGEVEQQLKVVSIVGPAGVGKTTLARVIFREFKGLFELKAFVHASRKIDMRRLLGSILSQVQPHHQLPSVAGTVQSLIDSIQEQLRDKRYLIVIDDLWEETAWDIVRGAFPEGNNSSRIVTTTENMNVTHKCCSYMAHNILKMKPLGIQDSGYLFFNRVFGSEQQCPDELKEVSYDIIRKCCGLPLSLIHVAGVLASIDYSAAELWYHLHDRLCSILNRSHTIEEIQKKILNLSYNSLPHCLKTCLLYFNMYPEGYIMWKVHLVKQWIAEGFINAAEGKDREEIAEGYFEELVNRGMVQPMKIDYNDKVLSCTVHHIIFDLINHNSKEEEFIAAIDYSQPITGHSTKAHRLSFRFSSSKYAKQPARITMSQLRSLGFFGFLKCMPPIVEFKHLRVLVLDFWGSHDGHMGLDFSRICILFQLRYLKISGDIMVELPAQMQGLHYLETLEIAARLSAVPLDIVHLPSLLHLGLRAATKLPDGIGYIKSLSTLSYFDLRCNSEDNIWSLSKLTNLQHLHLTCSAALSIDHLKRKLVPLVFSLGKFSNLKSLTLTPDALRTAFFLDVWSGISSPPMFLQKLELLPPICFFHRLPSQFGELHKLCILKIVVKELQGNDISNISALPSLVVFELYVRTALTGTIVFSDMAFPALKYFKFTCGVICLTFQAGAMPNLQRVKICFNAHRGKNHSRMLDGIEHLLNLQEVAGRIGVLPGADESDWRVVKLLFEDIIRKHPRCPRFNSQLVDFIEEEYPPLDKFHLTRHEGSSSEQKNIEKASAEDMDKHIDRLAEMEASEESSVTNATRSVSKSLDYFSLPLSPKELFRQSGEESEASLITPSPRSGKDILNHDQQIKKSTKQKIVIRLGAPNDKSRSIAMVLAAKCDGVHSVAISGDAKDRLEVVGESIDIPYLMNRIRKKFCHAAIIVLEEVKDKEEKKKEATTKKAAAKEDKEAEEEKKAKEEPKKLYMICLRAWPPSPPPPPTSETGAVSHGMLEKAALSIQKNFRCWKRRKEFLRIRNNIVRIQARVRAHQERKKYKELLSSVGVLEKVMIRWYRKGVGLRGFNSGAMPIDEEVDEDVAKVFRKLRVETAIDEAVSRVSCIIGSPKAMQQYRRMLKRYQQAKDDHEK